jgi:hypothetical protein
MQGRLGLCKASSADTEGELTPSAPPLEEIEELGRIMIGLSGRAKRQVRKLLTMLARMRKDLPPGAQAEAVRRLGWRLRPIREASRANKRQLRAGADTAAGRRRPDKEVSGGVAADVQRRRGAI